MPKFKIETVMFNTPHLAIKTRCKQVEFTLYNKETKALETILKDYDVKTATEQIADEKTRFAKSGYKVVEINKINVDVITHYDIGFLLYLYENFGTTEEYQKYTTANADADQDADAESEVE